MFLSLFPFPEVATIIALFLGLIYVAFGILGTNQAAVEDISTLKGQDQVQEQLYHQSESAKLSQRAYYWDQSLYSQAIKVEPVTDNKYCTCQKLVFKEEHKAIPNCLIETSIPNRAPPAI